MADELHRQEPFEEFTRPAQIEDKRSMRKKAQLFEEEINKDFLRDSGRLFWNQIPNDIGDMAIWQGYYTAFRAFEYDATKSEQTLSFLGKALDGIDLLTAGYGKAYLVRGVDPAAGDALKTHTYFHRGDRYDRVEDASGSSMAGVVFGLNAAYRFGDKKTRDKAGRLAARLARGFKQSGYRLRNANGSTTRWGDFRPNRWILDPAKLLTVVALFNLAHQADGDPMFLKEKKKFTQSKTMRKIAAKGEAHFLWYGKEYHQHLAFMSFYVLMSTEQDSKLRGLWESGFKKLLRKYRKEGNSFFTFAGASFFERNSNDIKTAIQTLQEFSFPKKRKAANNLRDLSIAKAGRRSLQPLPVWRRPNTDIVWQRDPYELAGPPGNRYTGLDFLIAYWMGRRLGFINKNQ